MKDEELINIWKSSPNEETMRLKKSILINNLNFEVNHLAQMTRPRSLNVKLTIVVVVSISVIMVFVKPTLFTVAGVLLSVVSVLYFSWRIGKTKMLKSRSYSDSYLEYLNKIKVFLKSEKNLSNDILFFGMPLYIIGMALFFYPSLNGIVGLIVLTIIMTILNRRTTKRHVTSKLEKVETLIKEMEE